MYMTYSFNIEIHKTIHITIEIAYFLQEGCNSWFTVGCNVTRLRSGESILFNIT